MVNVAENVGEEAIKIKKEFHWPKVLFWIHTHIFVVLGLYLIWTEAYVLTSLFCILLIFLATVGITAGSHRLWAHHAYTADFKLKVFLMLCQTLAGQGCIYNWVQAHRLHHKHFNTDKDPYNPSRGFFYAHLLSHTLKVSPGYELLEKEIDMSDLEKDSVVMFQKKYYWLLFIILFVILPINTPAQYWNESISCCIFIVGWLRYCLLSHMAWFIYSGTKLWGIDEGEKFPPDSFMVFIVTKSYWTQYHYCAPWDYQTGEYGSYGENDWTATFIRVCAALGLATHLRTITSKGVRKALSMSVDSKKPIEDTLLEIENKIAIPFDHYLDLTIVS